MRAGGQGAGPVREYSEIEVREKRGEHLASSTRRAQTDARRADREKKRATCVRGRLGHVPADAAPRCKCTTVQCSGELGMDALLE